MELLDLIADGTRLDVLLSKDGTLSRSRAADLIREGAVTVNGKAETKPSAKPAPGAQQARTIYRTISCENGVSLVECELLTGRTHQIRAQFAAAGHPLIGDTQYGDREINSKHASNFQQLYSYKLRFDFTTDAGILNYLKGKEFRVKRLHRGFEEISSRR